MTMKFHETTANSLNCDYTEIHINNAKSLHFSEGIF